VDYLAIRLLEGVMSEGNSLWQDVCGEAGLTSEEQHRLGLAIDGDDGLKDELTYLLSHLRADLSAAFLRAFVDRLPAHGDELDSAAFEVQPALRCVLIPPPETWEDPRA
jgi:hypothetical protein